VSLFKLPLTYATSRRKHTSTKSNAPWQSPSRRPWGATIALSPYKEIWGYHAWNSSASKSGPACTSATPLASLLNSLKTCISFDTDSSVCHSVPNQSIGWKRPLRRPANDSSPHGHQATHSPSRATFSPPTFSTKKVPLPALCTPECRTYGAWNFSLPALPTPLLPQPHASKLTPNWPSTTYNVAIFCSLQSLSMRPHRCVPLPFSASALRPLAMSGPSQVGDLECGRLIPSILRSTLPRLSRHHWQLGSLSCGVPLCGPDNPGHPSARDQPASATPSTQMVLTPYLSSALHPCWLNPPHHLEEQPGCPLEHTTDPHAACLAFRIEQQLELALPSNP
jgi:hypothetical protein